ncbi:MAG: hypothetical protein ACRCRZ_02140 [Metamycoplasmataceae bacterium]
MSKFEKYGSTRNLNLYPQQPQQQFNHSNQKMVVMQNPQQPQMMGMPNNNPFNTNQINVAPQMQYVPHQSTTQFSVIPQHQNHQNFNPFNTGQVMVGAPVQQQFMPQPQQLYGYNTNQLQLAHQHQNHPNKLLNNYHQQQNTGQILIPVNQQTTRQILIPTQSFAVPQQQNTMMIQPNNNFNNGMSNNVALLPNYDGRITEEISFLKNKNTLNDNNASLIETKLRKLEKLYKLRYITREEYSRKKREVIRKIIDNL